MTQNYPEHVPLHPWEWPASPWERVHVDFAGPFMGSTILVVVDACSKWPEVFIMSTTTSARTMGHNLLPLIFRHIFAEMASDMSRLPHGTQQLMDRQSGLYKALSEDYGT